jgi:hypothetical protein
MTCQAVQQQEFSPFSYVHKFNQTSGFLPLCLGNS